MKRTAASQDPGVYVVVAVDVDVCIVVVGFVVVLFRVVVVVSPHSPTLSSLPSEQSSRPSHLQLAWMHRLLFAHAHFPAWQLSFAANVRVVAAVRLIVVFVGLGVVVAVVVVAARVAARIAVARVVTRIAVARVVIVVGVVVVRGTNVVVVVKVRVNQTKVVRVVDGAVVVVRTAESAIVVLPCGQSLTPSADASAHVVAPRSTVEPTPSLFISPW